MPLSLYDIEQVFLERGHRIYDGEPVSHLKHALQTATLAEQAGASAHLVTACLLHDLGHLIADHPETPTLRGVDDKHQYFVLPFLRGLFGARVLDPIRLHVEAKRYLCYVEPDYALMLSEDSRRSLNLQGGSFDAGQAMDFAALPGAPDAIRLRRWDDLAKSPNMTTGSLTHFLELASSVSERPRLIAA
ncbi:HD domain-containing protein [Bordetella hinzii]|uniref:phosphonate degradation HD-domain oxygenase n=1 Tax=Bordetella hinzii TaxID=103855 RepID=UPI0013EFF887|nr:phosphonate degradation HD-domain oxygenase [Bordetella hinzii]QII85908.1 HD domain-containing protein [Bordetella hinzii]